MPVRTDRKLVLIVSQNLETAQHLRLYFESRGLLVEVATSLGEDVITSTLLALVVFPDELFKAEAEQRLRGWMRRQRKTKLVIITADTQRYSELTAKLDDGRTQRVVVLPRPAFSWTIFDHVVMPMDNLDNPRGP